LLLIIILQGGAKYKVEHFVFILCTMYIAHMQKTLLTCYQYLYNWSKECWTINIDAVSCCDRGWLFSELWL